MNRPIAITTFVLVLAGAAASASAQSTAPAASQKKQATAPAQQAAAKPAQPAAKAQVFDLNTATREQLVTLPGMTGTYADAIIKGRPFKSANELVSRKIMPETEYKKLSHQVTVEKKKG